MNINSRRVFTDLTMKKLPLSYLLDLFLSKNCAHMPPEQRFAIRDNLLGRFWRTISSYPQMYNATMDEIAHISSGFNEAHLLISHEHIPISKDCAAKLHSLITAVEIKDLNKIAGLCGIELLQPAEAFGRRMQLHLSKSGRDSTCPPRKNTKPIFSARFKQGNNTETSPKASAFTLNT